MAKFAQYYVRFNQERGCYDWNKRQEHFGQLLQNDEIKFTDGKGEGSKVYKHRIYHLDANPNIVVMRLANDKDVPIEKNFEATVAKDEPSCFIIIDNRQGLRTIAIECRKKAFNTTEQVSKILENNLTHAIFHKHCYSLSIIPDFYPEDLFEAWTSLQQHVNAIRFSTPEMSEEEFAEKLKLFKQKNKDYFDDSLMTSILQMAYEAKRANYKQLLTITPEEKKTALYLDKTSLYMRNLISISAAADMPVELITADGASYKCYVDAESENAEKIIRSEFNTQLLEELFDNKKKDGEELTTEERDKIEEHIVEFMNAMKHEDKDLLIEAA
jgi:hypothetical protein